MDYEEPRMLASGSPDAEETALLHPVAGAWEDLCESRWGSWVCTREAGHEGPHVAHGSQGEACSVWGVLRVGSAQAGR